jgi:hypothetical protein
MQQPVSPFHLLLFFTFLSFSTSTTHASPLSPDTITKFSSSTSSCSGYSSCTSCAASSGAGLGCSWCPIDNTCHNYGSILNDCQFYENIHNASLCGCSPSTCTPTGLTPPSGCSWYVNGTTAPGDDPSLWEGGDFLLETYGHAAECACSGDGNPLWNGAAANCVR